MQSVKEKIMLPSVFVEMVMTVTLKIVLMAANLSQVHVKQIQSVHQTLIAMV